MIKIVNSTAGQRLKNLVIPLLASDNKSKDSDYAFYAWFSLYINFYEDENIPTGGVRITKKGMEFIYNPSFLMSLPDKALKYFWLHEMFHLLNRHNQRLAIQGHKKETANIAMDIVVNRLIDMYIPKSFADYKDSPLENGIHLDKVEKDLNKKFNGRLIYENVYRWLIENAEEGSTYNPSAGQWGDSEGGNGHPQQFDVHLDDDVSHEVGKQHVDKAINIIRSRGNISGSTELLLKDLRKTKKDHLRQFAVATQGMNGNFVESTYRRPNKKIDGLKGKKSGGSEVAVILDTSGSMLNDFSAAVSQIFRNGYTIQFIQCDTEVKGHTKIVSPNQFRKLKLKGLGGTVLQPAIDYIRNSKTLNKLNLIILTDGYTDELETVGINKTLILTVNKECPIKKGNVKQIVIEQE